MVKVTVYKPHHAYKEGDHELDDDMANYLIKMGIAKPAEKHVEKEEVKKTKEKAENKTGNVPTAKKKK